MPPAKPTTFRRKLRQRAVKDLKRGIILAAARRVFGARGLDGASVRAIAREAGYAPAALYFHYANKEEIYGDLLAESLARLDAAVQGAMAAAPAAGGRLRAGALAFFDYYRDNPRDLDLGFYLFGGMKPLGLTPALNASLNAKLRTVLAGIAAPLGLMGADADAAAREAAALFAHSVGLLLMVHTGRIRIFGLDARALLEDYVARIPAPAAGA